MENTNDIVNRIKQGDASILNEIYEEYRSPFLHWIRSNYAVDEDQGIEVFQMSVVILYENIMTGKLTELNSSLRTYLFAIGKNKAREEHRKGMRYQELSDFQGIEMEDEVDLDDGHALQLELVNKELDNLGQPCKNVLSLYYYERKSMIEIAAILDYKNEATAKNQKYKCLQRLKKMVLSKNLSL